jgi:glutathione synthase/RimK-type ligase-like ATP-grasp enzyme
MASDLHYPQIGAGAPAAADRIGFAKLTKLAFDGANLGPLWETLMRKVAAGTAQAGEGLDLSLVAQLLGDKQTGLAIQAEVLGFHRLFRSPCASAQPKLRVLALAAPIDMGGNTPIEFLLEDSDLELVTLYVLSDADLSALPEHDVAIVIASDSDACAEALRVLGRHAAGWPRPLLNLPQRVANLDRDKLFHLLHGIDGLAIPATACVTRRQLLDGADSTPALAGLAPDLAFPIIIRPRGSHAGHGLAKVEGGLALRKYLEARREGDFFVSRFVDYASADGLYRKYRIVVVDGEPFACHMAICEAWNVWYLNAGMAGNASKRREEADFMATFELGFAARHAAALAAMIERIGLDYFTIDCAENKNGELLVFEADNTAVVHNMDPPDLYPYKPPQVRRIFDAFAAMLLDRARPERISAA